MNTLPQILQERVAAALAAAGVELPAGFSAEVVPAADTRYGDYQTNAAMVLAKQAKTNPRALAQSVIDKLDVSGISAPAEIAGPGFINFRILPDTLSTRLAAILADEKLGVAPAAEPRTVVIDFSSPNVAKSMHVGHIRSTILGDTLARVARFLGHKVITDNHIGDWGTQFGMLLLGWKTILNQEALSREPIAELERVYKAINWVCSISQKKIDELEAQLAKLKAFSGVPTEAGFQELQKAGYLKEAVSPWHDAQCAALAEDEHHRLSEEIEAMRAKLPVSATEREKAKTELVKLQGGDEENLAIWKRMIELSQVQFDNIYARLGITFDHTLGESFYNPWLKDIVTELVDSGIARTSEGAIAIFSDGSVKPEEDPFRISKDGEWKDAPALIQKADGASNYATTDLATLRYRMTEWQPDEIIYVTDGRQQLHFRQIFSAFRRWKPDAQVKLAHVWFGSILGEDGKPFKTRSGETVKLAELLDEAEERALAVVSEKNPDMPAAEQKEIARRIGIGAIKYADMLPNRQMDYIFSWDKMLALNGNTMPYMANAYVRCRSIFRKLEGSTPDLSGPYALTEPAESGLALMLIRFPEALALVMNDYRPNLLENYLFEVARAFHSFFEACPVLRSEGQTRATRLALCEATGRILRQGMNLLGIEVPERM